MNKACPSVGTSVLADGHFSVRLTSSLFEILSMLLLRMDAELNGEPMHGFGSACTLRFHARQIGVAGRASRRDSNIV